MYCGRGIRKGKGLDMKLIIGVITVLGVLAGMCIFLRKEKIKGIGQLVLAVVCPIIMIAYLSLKEKHAFGGTDWEFLVHSATVDRDIWPWIILILFVVEIIFIVRTICVITKKCEQAL